MRIVFIGASALGLKCLSAVEQIGECKVVCAVTAPRKFAISYRPEGVENILHADIVTFCTDRGIPCFVMDRGMNDPAILKSICSLKPDLFLVAGWYHMIPRSWRKIAPAYGLHASLLPDYSGGAPLVWAIINGETRTGITFFQLSDGIDDGPVVGQKEAIIFDDDSIATLYERIEHLGIQLVKDYLPRLASGSADLFVQDENRRRVFPQRSPEDGLIDWAKSSNEVYNFIRAQTKPYPGAFTFWKGEKLIIWESKKNDDHANGSCVLGEFIVDQDRLFVRTGSGFLEIVLLSFQNKVFLGSDFIRIILHDYIALSRNS